MVLASIPHGSRMVFVWFSHGFCMASHRFRLRGFLTVRWLAGRLIDWLAGWLAGWQVCLMAGVVPLCWLACLLIVGSLLGSDCPELSFAKLGTF